MYRNPRISPRVRPVKVDGKFYEPFYKDDSWLVVFKLPKGLHILWKQKHK